MAGFRESLPASLQAILQNGLLDHVFEDALVASFLYDTLADVRPWPGGLGSTSIMTRGGLLTPNTVPITGNDAAVSGYGFEQYQLQMNQYGGSIDTNMATSAMALASKFLEDNTKLGIMAAQSLDLVAQASLYGAYSGGNTYTTGAQSSTFTPVADLTGFGQTLVADSTTNTNAAEGNQGVAVPSLVQVSSSVPGYFLNGVQGIWSYTGWQQLGAAGTQGTATNPAGAGNLSGCVAVSGVQGAMAAGQSIVTCLPACTGVYGGNNVVATTYSPLAPYIVRPNAKTSQWGLQSTDVATLATFRNAVTRLKSQHVPQLKGAYTAHVSPQTVAELFQDTEFQSAYRGGAATTSPVYPDNVVGSNVGGDATFLGRLAGIDWIENTITPVVYNPAAGFQGAIYRDIVVGADALIKGPFQDQAGLLANMTAGSTVEIKELGGVVRILRAPLDRLGQVLSSTWSWIGGYTTGSDILTGDNAVYKRAVIVEHA